jgi:protein TonB
MKRNVLIVIAVFGSFAHAGWLSAQQLQFKVTPENQPKDTLSPETMAAYSALNRRLADAVAEPASSCLNAYATYQACKAGDSPSNCGIAPACSLTEPLPVMDLSGIRMNFPPGENAAVLMPASVGRTQLIPENGPPTELKIIKQDAAPPPVKAEPTPGESPSPGNGPVRIVQAPALPILESKGPVRISGGVIAGARTSFVQPQYPIVAKMAHLSGTVVMRAIISKTGTIQNLEVMSTSTPIFNNAAIDAVRQWVYKPYMLKGEVTEVDTTITVNFALNNPNKNPPAPASPSQNGTPLFPPLGTPH